jgi:hypothetical protein
MPQGVRPVASMFGCRFSDNKPIKRYARFDSKLVSV